MICSNPTKAPPQIEEDILRVHLDVLLLGMFAPALGRHVADRAFEDFQESLLHAFTTDIAGDADVFGLAANLVDLIDVDDADLGAGHIVVRSLEEAGMMFSTSSPT